MENFSEVSGNNSSCAFVHLLPLGTRSAQLLVFIKLESLSGLRTGWLFFGCVVIQPVFCCQMTPGTTDECLMTRW